MRVIFTHNFTDDSRRLFIWFIRRDTQLRHSVQNSSVHRLHTVAHVRKRTSYDYAHRVVDIGVFHLIVDFMPDQFAVF